MTRKLLFLPALALAAAQALAQQSLEIIALRHRTVEQVLPVLRPLLEPGGTLTGERGQLIVRASPANLAELRQALAAIDEPLRRLQISVRFDDSGESQRSEIQAGGRVSNRGSRVDIRAREDQSRLAERIDQRVQVLEGGRAFIMAGQAIPVPGGVWETATGFTAVPRLSGDTVHVDIAPQKESFDRQQRAATTVSARLGEWFELAGGIWLKVEELRP